MLIWETCLANGARQLGGDARLGHGIRERGFQQAEMESEVSNATTNSLFPGDARKCDPKYPEVDVECGVRLSMTLQRCTMTKAGLGGSAQRINTSTCCKSRLPCRLCNESV